MSSSLRDFVIIAFKRTTPTLQSKLPFCFIFVLAHLILVTPRDVSVMSEQAQAVRETVPGPIIITPAGGDEGGNGTAPAKLLGM